MTEPTVTITRFNDAKEVYRQKNLAQAAYVEAAEVVMKDVLINLHGSEHRDRRRLENRAFRRETFKHYEHKQFPLVIDEALKPHLAEGRAELVEFGHRLTLNLAAEVAGIDRPQATPEETDRLHEHLLNLIEGATLAHSTQDKEVRKAAIAEKLACFDEEFFEPSAARRRGLVDKLLAGEIDEDELPKDVLMILLRNDDQLHLDRDMILRETGFFLLAAAHTSATALTRAVDHILEWIEAHPQETDAVQSDRVFIQRCIHETLRLNPSNPVAVRQALAPVNLKSGVEIPAGGRVVIDLSAVNQDATIFGSDAAEFNPHRKLPAGVPPYGLSFGGGMHACIGQDLAGGLIPGSEPDSSEHLYGLVAIAVEKLLEHGVRRDPKHPAVRDANTKRPYWSEYPVIFR